MKNKKWLTYLMLIVVLGIWGKILYEIFAPKEKGHVYVNDYSSDNDVVAEDLETFEYELIADYRDPFLGKYKQEKKRNSPSKAVRKKKEPVVKTVKATRKWPKLEYNGKMKNNANQDATVFVKINDRDALMKVGETRNEVTLVKIFKDSLWLEFDEERKTIPYIK